MCSGGFLSAALLLLSEVRSTRCQNLLGDGALAEGTLTVLSCLEDSVKNDVYFTAWSFGD